ncbi:MAG: hypothetical protein AB7G28_15195 [Pirellulales bacterium]
MSDPSTDRESGKRLGKIAPRITSTPRERIIGAVLFLIYLGALLLNGYAYSVHFENLWPARVVWVVRATCLAVLLVMPVVAVCWLIGIDRSPAWMRGRISLRALVILFTLAAVVLGVIASLVK